jgi:hypothetical protein
MAKNAQHYHCSIVGGPHRRPYQPSLCLNRVSGASFPPIPHSPRRSELPERDQRCYRRYYREHCHPSQGSSTKGHRHYEDLYCDQMKILPRRPMAYLDDLQLTDLAGMKNHVPLDRRDFDLAQTEMQIHDVQAIQTQRCRHIVMKAA